MKKEEIYFSTDIEADGPIPGPHSMLSMASVALTADGKMLGAYSVNLRPLEGARPDPDTAEWWKRQPKAWAAVQKDQQDPEKAMRGYSAWVRSFRGRPVFVGYPTGFDFTFVYWYLVRFAGKSPFSFSALDIKSMAMVVLGTDFRETKKRAMPKAWFPKHLPHTHVALDDAKEQGVLFINVLKAARELFLKEA